MVGASSTDVYMMVPDGVPSVDVRDDNGATETVAVVNNLAAIHGTPSTASWITPSGVRQGLDHLSPTLPAAVKSALQQSR